MTKSLKALRTQVEKEIGAKAKRTNSTSVIETFRGRVLWDGVVETFEVISPVEVKRYYAFYSEDNGHERFVVVQEDDKVNSPELAVRTFLASRSQRQPSESKS